MHYHWRDGRCRDAALYANLLKELFSSALPSASSLRRETARLRLPDRSFRGLQQSRAQQGQQREAARCTKLCSHL